MYNANYKEMEQELKEMLHAKNYLMGNLANASAIIKQNMEDVSWVGFYLLNKDEMLLGPFQGAPARTRIPLFKGIIGKAMKYYRTEVDNDFATCPCSENCPELVRSQIAIPVYYNREPVGVLSIDSTVQNRFSDSDVEHLEYIVAQIQKIWRHMY